MHILHRKFVPPLCLLLASAGCPCLLAQHSPVSAVAPAQILPGAPANIAQPIYPLSLVRAGLHGTAYTVFQGSTPEPFDVEILGVLRDAIGPGKDMILARLTGTQAEYDGVVAGMSGSPVYIDGKLVGAIGYRIGQFTKQPIAGITPIEQMLEVLKENDSKQMLHAGPLAPLDSAPGAAETASLASPLSSSLTDPPALSLPSPAKSPVQPIATPMVFDGFSPRAIALFQQRFRAYGLTPVSGLGSADPTAADPAPVVPGSAISAVIVAGDFNMAATCTVTYVDPKQLLACGHPITRFGDISLPMTKAQVVATIASPLAPTKIINTTQTIGAFTQDRESAILGVFGEQAHLIPITLALGGIAQPHTYRYSVVEHPRLTSAAVLATVYQAMEDTNGYNDPSTYQLYGTIDIAGYPPVHIDDWIAPTDQQAASLPVALAVARRFESLYQNPRQLPSIRSVSLTLDASAGTHSAELADARVLANRVHAGDRITVEATLRPYRRPRRIVRLSVTLPQTLAPGPVRLLVSDGTTLDHTLHLIPNPAAPPLGLGETIARLNQLHPNDRMYVTLLAPVPQATLGDHDLPGVPLSMANILQPTQKSEGFTINSETAVALGSQRLDLALSGSQIVTLDVQP